MAAWDQAPIEGAQQPKQPGAKAPAWASAPVDAAPVAPPAPPAAMPASVQAGRGLMDIPRQIGLTARYGMEGLGQGAQLVTEPVRQYITDPLSRLVTGAAPQARSDTTGEIATKVADFLGLPKPQGADERVVGDMARLMAGSGGMVGAARGVAGATTGLTSKIAQLMAVNPGQQIAGAAGAGAAGGAVREAGGGPIEQALAALAGGVAAPTALGAATNAAKSAGNQISSFFRPAQNAQSVDQQIQLTLQRNGVDWSQVPERVRQSVRAEAQQALNTGGQLDPAALSRLVDFRRVQGATPTRGMLTLDPAQITRERNLAKTGANSVDVGMQSLSRVENANNQALIDSLNAAGAGGAPDKVATTERVMAALQRNLDSDQAGINSLYANARDTAGRSFPLDGAHFATTANKALDDALLGGSLPPTVAQHLNRIARGEVPFTVDYAEQLKTAIGNLQRSSTDGNTRRALGVVRNALDETPVVGLGQQGPAAGARPNNPGNLPATPNNPALGEQSVEAFNQARAANRAMMQRVESTPALRAVREGIEPDKFVDRFITGGGPDASVRSVQALRREIENDPQAVAAVRGHIADFLKQKALGGASDEVGNFSAANFRKALDGIGEQKLRAFFSPEEIDQLRAVSRVASYMVAQPKGSAVNNSNSGALMLGRGMDLLDTIAGRLPVGQDTVRGFVRGIQQGQATNVVPSLVRPAPQAAKVPRLPAATAFGGLFALPPVPNGQQDERP